MSGLLFPLVLILSFVMVWWLAQWTRYRRFRRLLNEGQVVQGVITEKVEKHIVGGMIFHRRIPYFRYRFVTREGVEQMSGKTPIPLMMRSLEEQDTVRILYLPDRPSTHYLSDNLMAFLRGEYFWVFVPFICGVLLSVPLLFTLIAGK